MTRENPFPFPRGMSDTAFGHQEIDRKFSTDYALLYSDLGKETDFNTLSYQMRGEKALSYGYLNHAIHDFSRAIELDPCSPLPYLERGVAHFGLGEYDRSLEDFHQYTSQTPKNDLCIPDFSLGFAKGLPKGIYDSGEGFFLFLSDLVSHPVHTGEQMWEALTLLSSLVRSEQWSAISEVLAPEVHQLVKEWDSLPSDMRGELAGYAFGKHGADIIIPGALAKAVSLGIKGAQELSIVSKVFQTTEKTFLLESVANLETGAKIAEVVQLEKNISDWLGEGTKLIRNKAGDPVFLSKDGLKRVRFDFNNPHGDKLHLHIEQKLEGRWQDATSQHRIYPIDG
jgi:tetratricopeptide (TPR) repeat protein